MPLPYVSPTRTYLRGGRLITRAEALRQLSRISQGMGTGGPRGFKGLFVGEFIPLKLASQGVLIVGEPGTGKSVLIKLLLRSFLPFIGRSAPFTGGGTGPRRGYGFRMAGWDCKHSLYPVCVALLPPHVRCHVMWPTDQRGVALDVAADVRTPSRAQQVGNLLIPDRPNDSNPYFPQTARDILTRLMIELILALGRAGGPWGFHDLLRIMGNREYLRRALSGTPAGRALIAEHLELGTTTANVLSTARSILSRFAPVGALWSTARGRLSLERFFDEEGALLLPHDDRLADVLGAATAFCLNTLKEIALSRNDGRPTLLLLDEFRLLPQAGGGIAGHDGVDLKEAFAKGRESGLIPVVAVQSWEGLVAAMGSVHRAAELWNLLGTKIFMRCQGEDAEHVSKSIGEAEYLETTHSFGSSETVGEGRSWTRGRSWSSGSGAGGFSSSSGGSWSEGGSTSRSTTTSHNTHEQVVSRRLVTREQVEQLPLASWQEGLTRAYVRLAGTTGFFYTEIPFRKALEPLARVRCPAHLPRPHEDEFLDPVMTEADWHRLGVT